MNPRVTAGESLSLRQHPHLRLHKIPLPRPRLLLRLPLLLLLQQRLPRQRHRSQLERKKRKMSSSMGETLTVSVVTVSDSCSRGEREDLSGPAVAQLLQKLGFTVTKHEIVPDDSIQIQNLLIRLAREVRFIVTTGGTGIAARDVTPESTAAVCERVLDGVAEHMRSGGRKKSLVAGV